ncbi:MAG: glycosyltransferase family protein [bacterium]|nr:glycosyltransferase family protein [bacterium]
MKILYGIAGHGNGHITRSSYVVRLLESKGHKVKILTYGQGIKYIKNSGEDFDYVDISGFDIYYRDGIVRNYKTFYEFIKKLPLNSAKQLLIFFKIIYDFKPHIVISDFEPFSQLAAKSIGIPLVDIDNNIAVNIVKENPEDASVLEKFYTKGTVNLFVRKAKYHFLLSFAPDYINVDEDKKYKLIIVPPIIRTEILEAKKIVEDRKFILIYQTSDSLAERIESLSRKFKDVDFVAYRVNLKESSNLKVKGFQKDEFIKDLALCSGIITNGGFTLISEAIYLGKPIYSVPISGQYEQRVNGFLVEKCGYGLTSKEFSEDRFREFLERVSEFKKNLSLYSQNQNKDFERKLIGAINLVNKNLPTRYYDQILTSLIPIIHVTALKFFFSKVIPLYKKQIVRIKRKF